jgi:hypothetical protein
MRAECLFESFPGVCDRVPPPPIALYLNSHWPRQERRSEGGAVGGGKRDWGLGEHGGHGTRCHPTSKFVPKHAHCYLYVPNLSCAATQYTNIANWTLRVICVPPYGSRRLLLDARLTGITRALILLRAWDVLASLPRGGFLGIRCFHQQRLPIDSRLHHRRFTMTVMATPCQTLSNRHSASEICCNVGR